MTSKPTYQHRSPQLSHRNLSSSRPGLDALKAKQSKKESSFLQKTEGELESIHGEMARVVGEGQRRKKRICAESGQTEMKCKHSPRRLSKPRQLWEAGFSSIVHFRICAAP
jgi:hypothetical protein